MFVSEIEIRLEPMNLIPDSTRNPIDILRTFLGHRNVLRTSLEHP